MTGHPTTKKPAHSAGASVYVASYVLILPPQVLRFCRHQPSSPPPVNMRPGKAPSDRRTSDGAGNGGSELVAMCEEDSGLPQPVFP
jgi:hypothetical protein